MLNILKNYFGHLQPCKHCHLLYRRREFSRPMLFSVGQPKPSVSGEDFSRGSGRMPSNTFHGSSDLAVPDDEILKKAKVNPLLLKPFFDPILCKSTRNYFETEVTVERLFDARVHLGHKVNNLFILIDYTINALLVGTLNDNMKWALYGERLGVCVFDLNITREYMIKALEFIRSVAYSGGRFLFVTSNRSSMLMVEETAERIGQYAHTRKWRTGTFINVKGILGGPIRLPDTVIVLNTLTSAMERHPAVIEAAKMCIPTVAVVDSNCEPNYVTYPIPGNDDSIASTNFYMEMFVKAIQKGQEESRMVTGQEQKQQQQSRQPQQRRKSMDWTRANSERR